jgi:hypothetical protein
VYRNTPNIVTQLCLQVNQDHKAGSTVHLYWVLHCTSTKLTALLSWLAEASSLLHVVYNIKFS